MPTPRVTSITAQRRAAAPALSGGSLVRKVTLTVVQSLRLPVNRRTLLGTAATLPAIALAGCQALGFSTPVILNIENETDTDRNVAVTAYNLDDDRRTYDESVNAPPGNTASLGHLTNTEQVVSVALFEGPSRDESANDASADDGDTTSDDGESDERDDDTDRSDDTPDESDDDVEAVEETFIGDRTQSITIHITDDGIYLDVASRES